MSAFKTLAEVEREHTLAVLEAFGWDKVRAAVVLGVSVKTVYNYCRRFEEAGLIERDGKVWKLTGKAGGP